MRRAGATALAVLGTALLVAGEKGGGATPRGVALALGAGVAFAVYVIGSKDLLQFHEQNAVIAVVFGLSALFLLPLGPTVTLSLAEPLTAAALGVLFLGERLGPTAAIGSLLIVAGLVIVGVQPSFAGKHSAD